MLNGAPMMLENDEYEMVRLSELKAMGMKIAMVGYVVGLVCGAGIVYILHAAGRLG